MDMTLPFSGTQIRKHYARSWMIPLIHFGIRLYQAAQFLCLAVEAHEVLYLKVDGFASVVPIALVLIALSFSDHTAIKYHICVHRIILWIAASC